MNAWKLLFFSDITRKNQVRNCTALFTYAEHDVGKHASSLFKRSVLFLLICSFLSSASSTGAFSNDRPLYAVADTGFGFSKTQPPGAFDTSPIASDTSHRPFVGRGAPKGAPLAYSSRPSQENDEEEGDSDPAETPQRSTHAEYQTEVLPVASRFASDCQEENSADCAGWRDSQEMPPRIPSRALFSPNTKRKEFLDAMKMAKSASEGRGVFRRLIGLVTDDELTVDALAMAELAKKLHDWNVDSQRNPGKTKLIIAMRHAESTYNVWRRESFVKLRFRDMIKRDWGETDVPLSPEGHKQCLRANRKLSFLLMALRELEHQQTEEGKAKVRPFCFDTFLVSPLTRSLITAANSMHGIDSKWHCSCMDEGRGTAVESKKSAIWLVDSLLREKISTMGDIGTERQALFNRLMDLHSTGKLQSAAFDFGLVPERGEWWVPHTEDQLRALILRNDESKGCTNCWSDTASTAASETGETMDAVLRLGSLMKRPLSIAENSMRNAFEVAERPSREPFAVDRRMAEWQASNSRLPIYQTVPSESNSVLSLRAKLLLSVLCRAKEADRVFFVTHSLFLKALTGESKFANAEFRAYTLACEGTPTLRPL